jgi:hypothetical protein
MDHRDIDFEIPVVFEPILVGQVEAVGFIIKIDFFIWTGAAIQRVGDDQAGGPEVLVFID